MTAARAQERSVNGSGVFLVIVGAALVLLAVRYLHWYSVSEKGIDTSGSVTFDALHSSADQLGGAGMAAAYFGWLALAALIAGVVTGVLANLPWVAADGFRVLGFAVGLVGAGTTYYALRQHFNATGSTHGVFYHSTWGVWTALGGFAVVAIGSLLGPRTS